MVITLLSDFGDVYPASMKGVILNIDPGACIVDISHSFHGRDIFAPVGAHISKGMDICEVGKEIFDFVDLDFGKGKLKGDSLEGKVIFIDPFGNIVTNIPPEIVDLKAGDIIEFQGKSVLMDR